MDPHTAYRPDRDFIITEVTARVIVAAMKVLGIESLSSDPLAFPIPANFEKEDNYTKLKFLHQASAKVVDEIVIDQSTFALYTITCILENCIKKGYSNTISGRSEAYVHT